MDKYIIKRFAILSLILFVLAACDEKMEEMNTNPLSLAAIPDEYLFTNAVRQSFGNVSHDARFGSQYAHVFVTNSEMRRADGYDDFHSQDIYKEMFSTTFTGPIRYITRVLDLTSEGEFADPVRHAMAEIIAVINFAHATDCFGDVPYTQGGLGLDGILYPVYDTQEAIYVDMMDRLKQSVAILKDAGEGQGYQGADPIYDNDLTKWTRFANSLRLRLAMRIRFADPEGSAAVISECVNEGLFIENNSQNFALPHQESENPELYNPWYDLRKYQNFRISEKFVNWLKSTNDPRLEMLADTTASGEYLGFPNGLNDRMLSSYPWNNYSSPNPILFSKSLPQFLMCASEVWFLRAEAALFGLGTGDANALYRTGIEMNFLLWDVPADKASLFLSTEPEATLNGSDENKFRQISTQAWIAFVPNFTEAWCNIRRTGYPEIPQRTDPNLYALGVTDGILPKRYKYASSEYLTNKTNLEEAIQRQGPDKIDTPVWWDVRGN